MSGPRVEVIVQLLVLTDGTIRRATTWNCPPECIPSFGDTVVVDDQTRRVRGRRWRGGYLVQVFLGEPLAVDHPYSVSAVQRWRFDDPPSTPTGDPA